MLSEGTCVRYVLDDVTAVCSKRGGESERLISGLGSRLLNDALETVLFLLRTFFDDAERSSRDDDDAECSSRDDDDVGLFWLF